MSRISRNTLSTTLIACTATLGFVICAAPASSSETTLRVTPPVEAVHRVGQHQVSLNGSWQFVREASQQFDPADPATYDALEWKSVNVPGHFSSDGYGRMHKEFGVPVAYRKTFAVPATWDSQRIALRFDSVEGLTTVFINGQRVDQRDTHYLPYELDITDFVEPGQEADILLKIAKSSITQWWRPEKGGIRRDVWLQALPLVNLASLNVTTDFDEQYQDATMHVRLKIANQSEDSAESPEVQLSLIGPDGKAIDLGEHATHQLDSVEPGQLETFTLSLPIVQPSPWNPDFPNLYRLETKLVTGGGSVMSASRTFGFRELEVDGHLICLNGQPIKLRGVNFHQTWPSTDYYTPVEKLRKDMEISQAANTALDLTGRYSLLGVMMDSASCADCENCFSLGDWPLVVYESALLVSD
ncbi:MAG: sugar-binding domain-containing protein [Planctomycetota bacterium]